MNQYHIIFEANRTIFPELHILYKELHIQSLFLWLSLFAHIDTFGRIKFDLNYL